VIRWSDDLGVTDDPDRFEEAIKAFERRVPMPADEYDALEAAERQRAFKVAAVAEAEVVQRIHDAISAAIENGTGIDEFRQAVGQDLFDAWEGEAPARLDAIFRTNTLGAYNAGRYEIFTRPEVMDSRPYWRFDSIDDERRDDVCADCDGVILPADDPWWRTHIPPLHNQCRCSYIALTEQEARDEGAADDGPDAPPAVGFGAPPAPDDWQPDPARFDDPIREILERALAETE
jgi:SPP1 gp7 family putative phage head morphogenesis protein